ncbi:hypothetical protein EJ110_NYTH08475 [Nymphaea thermarum]|nr:hypothetical protein EJ110_NYTH08475 [Nymphaea thermarum]
MYPQGGMKQAAAAASSSSNQEFGYYTEPLINIFFCFFQFGVVPLISALGQWWLCSVHCGRVPL